MKKLVILIFIMVILTSLSSCFLFTNEEGQQTIGVFMPCYSNTRWRLEANEIERILESEGYNVVVSFASKDSELQAVQIEEMANEGADAMIIAPVSIYNLSDTLDSVYQKGIKIIAYDKLPVNTQSIDYYAAFDNNLIGAQQATSLIEGLRSKGEGPYNIEIFLGLAYDDSSVSYCDGAMSVLNPLIYSGEIIVPSSQITAESINANYNHFGNEEQRLKYLLLRYYSDGRALDGILSPSDKISKNLISVLDRDTTLSHADYPILTGQNASISSVKAIVNSKQYSTIYKDFNLLAQVASSMVMAVLNDEIPEINDNTSFDNGAKIVPAFLCEPILVTKENYQSVLIETGYYKYDEIFS